MHPRGGEVAGSQRGEPPRGGHGNAHSLTINPKLQNLNTPPCADYSRAIWSHHFGAPGLIFAAKLTDLHHIPRMSAWKYRGTSLIRNRTPLGPYSRIMPRAL